MATDSPLSPDVDLPGQQQDQADLDIVVKPEPDPEPEPPAVQDGDAADGSAADPEPGNTLIRPENS